MGRVIEIYLYPFIKILDSIPYQHNTLHFLVATFIAIVFSGVGIFGFTILERDIRESLKKSDSHFFLVIISKWVIYSLKSSFYLLVT